ncbi:hypothetical protein E2562_024417 [Oryza meyeriana var. granulata]|uniref:Uncharacterized protein n=1 Tax=Oryza meyeriana var. granulata TaxID=110450 RepID=A0A6G1EYL5_9ORYZ|nr:hypothetical protein E2562_024417 [Oryza meyeriana var. granulata]
MDWRGYTPPGAPLANRQPDMGITLLAVRPSRVPTAHGGFIHPKRRKNRKFATPLAASRTRFPSPTDRTRAE